MIDKRLLKIGVQVGNDIRYYEDLDISASGSKVTNEIPNEFTIKITNLQKSVRDRILTESNILNRGLSKKKIYIYAGRESYGYSLIFSGDIRQVSISQPPDISLSITTYTGDASKMEAVSQSSDTEMTALSQLSQNVAEQLEKQLVFEATDKQIGSFAYTGSKLGLVSKLASSGGVNAYIDDETLVVKDSDKPLKGGAFDISADSGMIGIPTVSERGVSVKIMFNPNIRLGGSFYLRSELNPSINGAYIISKITYDLQNRNQNFYCTIEGIISR